jgi:hypothetical protein
LHFCGSGVFLKTLKDFSHWNKCEYVLPYCGPPQPQGPLFEKNLNLNYHTSAGCYFVFAKFCGKVSNAKNTIAKYTLSIALKNFLCYHNASLRNTGILSAVIVWVTIKCSFINEHSHLVCKHRLLKCSKPDCTGLLNH